MSHFFLVPLQNNSKVTLLDSEEFPVYAIALIILGVFILFLVLGVVVFLGFRRRRRRTGLDDDQSLTVLGIFHSSLVMTD